MMDQLGAHWIQHVAIFMSADHVGVPYNKVPHLVSRMNIATHARKNSAELSLVLSVSTDTNLNV